MSEVISKNILMSISVSDVSYSLPRNVIYPESASTAVVELSKIRSDGVLLCIVTSPVNVPPENGK